MEEIVLAKIEDGIGTITLNRQEVGNAFSVDSYDMVAAYVKKMSDDPAVRVVILTGAGRFFSAGGDIVEFKGMIEDETFITEEAVLKAGAMARSVRECEKPVIAMVNGAAAGAGASLALACDFRVMTPKSKIVMSFINMGFPGDTGAIMMMNAYLGLARATEYMALATPLGGEKCLELGLCNRLAAEGELEAETMQLAQQLASIPTKGFACQKKIYLDIILSQQPEFTQYEAKYMRACSMSNDHKEAVYAFLEKRKPNFTGS